MTLFQFILIQVNLCVFYAVYVLFFQRTGWLKVNRLFLLMAPILAITIPFISLKVGSGAVARFTANLQSIPLFQLPTLEVKQLVPMLRTVEIVYLVGGLLATLIFVVRLIRLLNLPKGQELSLFEGVRVTLIDSRYPSFSFGNRIFLSEKDQGHQENMVLLHEKAHVQKRHSFDLIVLQIYVAFFWFNPVIWYWNKAVRANHEFQADRFVVEQAIPIKDYRLRLLSAALDTSISALANGFNSKSMLRSRIEQLNICKPKIYIKMKYLLIIPVLAGVTYLASCQKEYEQGLVATNSRSDANHDGIKVSTQLASTNEGANKVVAETERAQFPGGQEALINFMVTNIKYPETMYDQKKEAKVLVRFMVDEQGKVTNVEALEQEEEIDASFTSEAIRVVSNMPNYKPAMREGKPVQCELVLPIRFKL